MQELKAGDSPNCEELQVSLFWRISAAHEPRHRGVASGATERSRHLCCHGSRFQSCQRLRPRPPRNPIASIFRTPRRKGSGTRAGRSSAWAIAFPVLRSSDSTRRKGVPSALPGYTRFQPVTWSCFTGFGCSRYPHGGEARSSAEFPNSTRAEETALSDSAYSITFFHFLP